MIPAGSHARSISSHWIPRLAGLTSLDVSKGRSDWLDGDLRLLQPNHPSGLGSQTNFFTVPTAFRNNLLVELKTISF